MKTTSINPATGKEIETYKRIGIDAIANKIKQAHQTQLKWKVLTLSQRASFFHKLAAHFDEKRADYARIATEEMGKTIGQAQKEIEKCAWVCRYYATNAPSLLSNQFVETEATRSYITFQPLGVILAVMPWNFPFYQAIRFIVPAMMAGNTCVLKHASNVQGCANALEKAFTTVGFPKGSVLNINIPANMVEVVIKNDFIKAITLTGSEPAGRAVAKLAGAALKKTVLELGGSDAYIVLEDADLDQAAELLTIGRLQNNGQTCIAAKRLIVVDCIYEDFLQRFATAMKAKKMGDPMDEQVDYGPLARTDLRDELHEQVKKTIQQGGRLIIGGEIPAQKGAYYPATILADLKPGMEGFDQELFGPVAAVIRAKDENEAIALANCSKFGLGGGVITADKKRGEEIALQLEVGNSFVNKLVASDPRLPFGGVKNSGYGRELSQYGMQEFVSIKTVWVD